MFSYLASETDREKCLIIFGAALMSIITATIFGVRESTPSAMDVYQGRTTLEITYKDGVAIDSTVVFKTKGK